MPSPKKLSHLVLQTNRREQMVDWYCKVLGAELLYQNKFIAFISYDDEHHRVAFVDPGPLAEKAPQVLRDKPVLLVWSMKDRGFGSYAVIDRWKTYFPRAETVVLPNANHYIQEDAPEEIAAAVIRRFGTAAA